MTNKTLFITGASTGIGAATARAAAKLGWNVALFARSADKLSALADELGEKALPLAGDVTDLAAVNHAVAQTVETFGGIDAAFANAGRGVSAAGTEQGDPAEWRSMIDINIMGVLYTAHATMPALKRSKGTLVLTGSAAGKRHIPGSVYGASKWFIQGYGGNMSEEMHAWGGRCCIIAPGMVDTPFFEDAKPDKLHPEDVANAVIHAITAPARASVREIFLTPQN